MSHQDAEKNKRLRETIIEIDEDGKVHGDISELKATMQPIVPSDPDDPRFDGVVVEREASGGALSAESKDLGSALGIDNVSRTSSPVVREEAAPQAALKESLKAERVEAVDSMLEAYENARAIDVPHEAALAAHDQKVREQATLDEHKSHVEFESELYATLVDPVAEGSIKEAEMRKQLLEQARWYRQRVHDLTDFVALLKAADDGLKIWAGKNPRWWNRIDGTPIPNDLLVNVVQAIQASRAEEEP